ncbi:MAG TPA: hypothetical protein PK129_00810 [Cellvibrionaceae bacterium]|nr:hypothetical protein [Cellvibrionaceae bacterium]
MPELLDELEELEVEELEVELDDELVRPDVELELDEELEEELELEDELELLEELELDEPPPPQALSSAIELATIMPPNSLGLMARIREFCNMFFSAKNVFVI